MSSLCLLCVLGVVFPTVALGETHLALVLKAQPDQLPSAARLMRGGDPELEDSYSLLSHHPRVVGRPPTMLQVSVELDRAKRDSPPEIPQLSLVSSLLRRTRSGDSMLVIFVLVGVPLVVAVFCMLYMVRGDGKPAGLLDGAASRQRSPGGSRDTAMGTQASLAPHETTAPVLGSAHHVPSGQHHSSRPVLVRCDSVSSSASAMPVQQANDVGTLCPALIVPKPSGVTLIISGELLPVKQEVVVNIAAVDVTTETILRLLISETGTHSAILLESVLKLPIAIMETPKDKEDRRVLVRRDMDPTHPPFAIIQADTGCFSATRASGEHLLSVMFDNRNHRANVVGADGKLLASVETKSDSLMRDQRVVNISQNADAALVICSIVACVKLS